MEFSPEVMLACFGLAFAMIVGIVVTAPSTQAGLDRLKLLLNTAGLVIVGVGTIAGVVLLAWGLVGRRADLIFASLGPFVAAGFAYSFITRRYATWYGVLGFNDNRERRRAFWSDTRRVWGYGPSPGDDAQPPYRAAWSRSDPQRHPGAGRSFTFSFRIGSRGDDMLGPVAQFAAHRLSSDRVSVFPNRLQIAASMGAHLASFSQQLTVRRNDGGPLTLTARTDMSVIALAVGPRGSDGSYPISVSRPPERLQAGTYGGEIAIDTGDPWGPALSVPVTVTVD